jgi:N-acyl-D-amino-acid deacylase
MEDRHRDAHDLVIRSGTVVDGSGLAPYRADVGVSNGRIAAIGKIRDKGRCEIDAEGHVVTPGFIDGHTHMDAQVFWDPLGTCSCWHGVTTVVMGNCGFTLAPVRADQHAMVVRNLERAEDISPQAMATGISWSWETFPEFLDAVSRVPKGINYAANIGHSALRTWAMGQRAFEDKASADDLAAMQQQLVAALKAGAVGFTTSVSENHETSDGRPVASRMASWEEVCSLVGTVGASGSGIAELSLGNAARTDDDDERRRYLDQLRMLALDSGAPLTFGVAGPRAEHLLDLCDVTAAAGGRMFGQSHSRGVSVVLSFKNRLPFDSLPVWDEVRSLPLAQQAQALRDPPTRRRLVDAANRAHYGQGIGAEIRPPDYEVMRVLEGPVPPNPSVAELARSRNVDPVELMIDLALESNFDQFFVQPIVTDDPDVLLPLMKHPRSVMTFSDAGAHVSQVIDASIQTHLLAYWVRQLQAFTLEEAVRMITLAPARAWGFADRGLLREGLVADINVFDPAVVAPSMPVLASDLPAGAMRLRQESIGFRATVVGGEVVHLDGEHTGALPGRLLRRTGTVLA